RDGAAFPDAAARCRDEGSLRSLITTRVRRACRASACRKLWADLNADHRPRRGSSCILASVSSEQRFQGRGNPIMSTYKNFTVETDADGIVLVTWDMPDKSMNVFTVEVMDEIEQILDATTADEAIKGVVFTSGKSSFSGGADLTMIKGMFS